MNYVPELKSGMILKLKNGESYIYFEKDKYLVNDKGDTLHYGFTDNLIYFENDNLTVMKIYKTKIKHLADLTLNVELELIWERKEIDWTQIPSGTKVYVQNDINDYLTEGEFLEYDNRYVRNGFCFKVRLEDCSTDTFKYCKLVEK